MKCIFIILLGMFMSANTSIYHGSTEFGAPIIAACPEIEDKYMYYMISVLSGWAQNPEWKEMLAMQHPVDREEMESLLSRGAETPQLLREYLHRKGVEAVTDPDSCKKMGDTLDAQVRSEQYPHEYKRVYYQIGNTRYLILFVPAQTGFSERNFPPPQVMDEEFNIIGKLDLKRRR